MERFNRNQEFDSGKLQNFTSSYYTSAPSSQYDNGNVTSHYYNGSDRLPRAIVTGSQQLCTLVPFILDGVIQGVISLVCFIVNFLTIATFSVTKPFNAMSFLLIVLAAFDIGVVGTILTYTLLPAVCVYLNQCKYFLTVTRYYIFYLFGVESFCNQVTVYVVAQVALHRYIAVCHPHHVKRFASIKAACFQTVCIIVFSAVFNTPKLFENTPMVANGTVSLGLSAVGYSRVYQLLYASVLYYVVLYAMPFSALVFLTYKLIMALRKFYARREQMTTASMRENAFTKTLVVMIIFCIICQAINPIRRFMVAVGITQHCGSFYFYFNTLNSVTIVFESTVHFFIYCFFDKRFVHNMHKLLSARNSVSMQTSVVRPETLPRPSG